MGKFNLKFVKPVASLAIGAAVLTGSFAVTGAADTAFAKAATVKVSKGKLVSAKSGKAVKGYKSYKGVLYKNGKKFTGLYKNTYYKSGKKGTGLYKNVYYKAGKKGSGWVGSGSSKKWYQDGKLLTGLGKNSGKLFIKGKYANGIQTYKGVEKLYKNGVVVKTVVDAAKAINNTTVEVTFASAQKASDISAGRFKIEGLDITNASIKQSDDKVIVLTTAAQTGGKTYTVALDGVKSRTFKGVSNVLPTAITNVTPSLQGIIGKEVTVKTQVDVPAGQSKEGIAVTFSITNSADTSVGNFGKKIVAEAFTDANGVASYSYTQYVAGTDDTVEAYPTGNASVKATAAKVYWGNTERLTISEVTTGNALANGSKKVYKVKAQNYATAYDSNNKALYNYVNVAFAENVNVTPDKLVRGAQIQDTGIAGNDSYPSQVTTGGVNKVQVKLDANGEATFTVTGSNAAVTPIVFVDAGSKGDKLDSTELQAKAATVTFALSHTLGLAVKAEGVQNAAAINTANANNKGTGEGGRTYTVTVTDKDGKVASAGTKAYVTFAEGSYSTDKFAYIKDAKGNVKADKSVQYEIEVTGTKGEATFTLIGAHDAYAAPTVYLENGKEVGLDKADLQTVGETTYFVNAVVTNAVLSVEDVKGNEVTSLSGNDDAYFTYQSVDQNEFNYYTGSGDYAVTYQVKAGFADVTIKDENSTKTITIKKGTTETFTVNAVQGQAKVKVTSLDKESSSTVHVSASASQASLPNKDASVSFTKASAIPTIVTDVVSSIDTDKQTIKLGNYETVSYKGATYKLANGSDIDVKEFVKGIAAKPNGKVTYKKSGDVVTFTLLEVAATDISGYESSLVTAKGNLDSAITAAKAASTGKTEGAALGNQIVGSGATLNTAITVAQGIYNKTAPTLAEVNSAKTDLDNAVNAYNAATVASLTGLAAVTLAAVGNTDDNTTVVLSTGETLAVNSSDATKVSVTADNTTGKVTVKHVAAGSATITVQVKNAAGKVIKTGTFVVTAS